MKIVSNPTIGLTAISIEDEEVIPILKFLGLKLKDDVQETSEMKDVTPISEEEQEEVNTFTVTTDTEGRASIGRKNLEKANLADVPAWNVYGTYDGRKIFITGLAEDEIDWGDEKVYFIKTVKNLGSGTFRTGMKFDNKRFKIRIYDELTAEAVKDFIVIYTNRDEDYVEAVEETPRVKLIRALTKLIKDEYNVDLTEMVENVIQNE